MLSNVWREEESEEEMENDAKDDERDEENVKTTRRCFASTTLKSHMTTKVHDLFISLNSPLQSYDAILCEFDETCS